VFVHAIIAATSSHFASNSGLSGNRSRGVVQVPLPVPHVEVGGLWLVCWRRS
jgi:hypothetical protein